MDNDVFMAYQIYSTGMYTIKSCSVAYFNHLFNSSWQTQKSWEKEK